MSMRRRVRDRSVRTQRPARRATARFRPGAEALEQRLAPANFVLTTLADDGSPGSLRAAITQSNLTPEADTITIPLSIYPGGIFDQPVIRLNGSPLPTVTGTMSIVGQNGGGLFGDGIFQISGDGKSRVLQVASTGNLYLENLAIRDGFTTGDGGAILNEGTLTLERVSISASVAANGGGIASTGPMLTVRNSTIAGNTARLGGGVLTSGASATFFQSTITGNTARGADNLTVNPPLAPTANHGGAASGGGLAILNGVVAITTSTISDNLAEGGKGGPGGDGAAGAPYESAALSSTAGKPGLPGGAGAAAGGGGTAQGGGVWINRGVLDIRDSTLSGNRARGGAGGTGGHGGAGGPGQDGGAAERNSQLAGGGPGGAGGEGGVGGRGGGGGLAFGGGLYLGFDVGNLNIVNSTIAGNQAIGGQGGRGGDGGAGGNGGRGGDGIGAASSGSGGPGGNGGNGGTTGAAGTGEGGGVFFSPSAIARSLINSTVAYNNATAGPAGPAAGAGGAGGFGGTSLAGPGSSGMNGAAGAAGGFGGAGGAVGGGLIHDDAAFGTGNFRLTLINSIVAANTVGASTPSDIVGTLTAPDDSVANLIGTGGAGGLVHFRAGNLVNVSNPGLRPLGHYGGPTQTVALASGSPAVNAGSSQLAGQYNLITDQRGFARAVGGVDIGAYELQVSYVVTTLNDEDNGSTDPGEGQGTSLREAVALANLQSTPRTITFAPGLVGTIQLSLGSIRIRNSMSIEGPGAKLLTVDARGRSTVFLIDDANDQNRNNVTIRGLTITGGSMLSLSLSSGTGGGIYNLENLTLDAVFLHGNEAGFGGGILSGGPLTVTNSTIANNTSSSYGGGIFTSSDLTVVNSTITGNVAGIAGSGIEGLVGAYAIGRTILINVTMTDSFDAFSSSVPPYPLTLQNTIFTGTSSGQSLTTYLGANLVGQDAGLGPLGDYGGPTPTIPLLPGSPAIDAGDNAYARGPAGTALAADQRGYARISGAAVDLGAFESQRIDLGPATLADGNVGFDYNQSITASQAGQQPSWGQIFFVLVDGALPTGLTLSSDGLLSGTPSEVGTYTFTIGAVNLAGAGSRRYTVSIAPTPKPVVDTLADTFDLDYSPGHVSLREAIDLVNRGIVAGPVTFAPGLSGTITLGLGPLEITHEATILGPGSRALTIDAGGRSRVFRIDAGLGTDVRIDGLTITGGRADIGGGLSNYESRLSLNDVVVTGNSGGGIYNLAGEMSIANSTIEYNSGAGILIMEGFTSLLGSTIAYNTGDSGGGISLLYGGALSVVNSTIAGNSANRGGGLYVQGDFNGLLRGSSGEVTFTNVTLAGNSAGQGAGAYVDFYAALFLGNTIIADNDGPQVTTANFQADVIAVGPNLIEGGLAGYPEILSDDPKLGPLRDNGGPTKTMALLPGSPAIDAGDGMLIPAGTPGDQRGAGFARITGGAVDLGAFETQLVPPTISVTLAGVTADEGSPASNVGAYSGTSGNGTVTVSASLGTVTQDKAAGTWSWSYTPSDGPAGPTLVTITATDDQGLTATTTFTLTVNNVAPTATITGAPSAGHSPEGTTIHLGSTVTDASPADAGAGFTYSWSVTRDGVAYASGTSASFAFTPGDDGTYVVTLTATDKDGAASLPARTTIVVDNVAPTITAFTVPTTGVPASPVLLSVSATDPGGANDPLTYTWTLSQPGGGTVVLNGASVSFTPSVAGTWGVALTVSDGDGGSDSRSASIQVGRPPAEIRLDGTTVPENRPSGTVVGTLSTTNADGRAKFTYTLVNGVGGEDNGAFRIVGNRLQTAATFDYEMRPSYSIRVRSTDAGGAWTETVFTISVTDVNERPTLIVPGAQTAFENVGKAITGISVGDVDSGVLTVTLSVGHGRLSLPPTKGLTVTYSGTRSVALTGGVADVNAALAGLVYFPDSNFGGNDKLTVTASDGSLSTQNTVAIAVKSIQRQVTDLRAQVTSLRTAGVLDKAQATVLIAWLPPSATMLDIAQINGFLLTVNQYRSAGILTPEQADDLLAPGNILLLSLTRR